MSKKKPTKIPEGITMKRTSTGINVTISENGRILAVLRGYNNTQNMHKGLLALHVALHEAWIMAHDGKFDITDLTPKPKKAAKKAPKKR